MLMRYYNLSIQFMFYESALHSLKKISHQDLVIIRFVAGAGQFPESRLNWIGLGNPTLAG